MQSVLANQSLKLEFETCTKMLSSNFLIQPYLGDYKMWQIVVFISSGSYSGIPLIFNVLFEDFPNKVPIIIFQTGVSHPLIDHGTFRLDTSQFCSEWSQNMRVFSLLNYVYEVIGGYTSSKIDKDKKESFIKNVINHVSDVSERNEMCIPKKWNNQKEKLCLATTKI